MNTRVIRIGNYRLGRTLGEGTFAKVKRIKKIQLKKK
jgi:serine/threonine protein kinase